MHKVVKTACNRDCPDACSLVITVEDGYAIRLQGDKEDPVTAGFLCERTSRFLKRQYAEDRILSPMLRRNGKLTAIDWDEAIGLAAEKMLAAKREHGPASIFHYRSGGSLGILKGASDVLFNEFGPVSVKHGDICSGAGEAAQEADFGFFESHDLFDILESRMIVVWGKNPHVSGVHLLPVLKKAKAGGAKIVGIDPIRTKTASLSDLFLMPRPGSDYAVAMAVARHLFETGAIDPLAASYCDHLDEYRALAFARSFAGWAKEADVPHADLHALADLYARNKPAAILVGWGMGRRRNGARTVRAIDALAAISGNLGIAGGGVSFEIARRGAFDTTFGATPRKPPRTFSEARLGHDLLAAKDPNVRIAWITAGNPISMLPESATVRAALEKIDFVVVVDTHPTDTTDVADLILPTLTLLEDSDVLGAYGNHWLRVSEPAIDPPGAARHEMHIWQALADRLGIGEVMAGTIDGWKRRAMRRLEEEGVTLERLRQAPVKNPFVKKVLFEDRRFATPNGKVQLLDTPAAGPPTTNSDYPMTLLAASSPKGQASQWSLPISKRPPEVFVHPDSAAGHPDGDEAWLESGIGRIRVTVRIDPEARHDIARMEKGGMMRDRRCANVLVLAEESDFGGAASFYDQLVRLV